jgi:hypothetical protein
MDRLRRGSSVIFVTVILVMTLLLTACPQGHTVEQILRDPARYQNKEVAVRGTVISSWGALGTGMYQLDDGTGKIWVMSDKFGVPGKGTRVGVAGTIVPTVNLGGRNFATVLRETQRRKD